MVRTKKKEKTTAREKVMQELKQSGRRQSRAMTSFRELVAKHCGMSINDVICCDYLLEHGQALPGQLAKITGLTTGAITGVVSRLEKLGYITSERSSTDKRHLILKPLPEKMVWHKNFYGPISKDLAVLYAEFSTKELQFIAYYQSRISRIFQKQADKMSK